MPVIKEELKTFINSKPKDRELPLEGVEIVDNFLTEPYLKHLQSIFFNQSFPWCYSPFVGEYPEASNLKKQETNNHLYFIHKIYDNLRPIEDSFQTFDQFLPILEALKVRSLVRIRALLYVNQTVLIKHETHKDAQYPIKAALLYLNDSNGYTGFEDGTKVDSVCNRVALFDGSLDHHSTTCTDAKERLVININYF
tara:strand:+ start:44 stop:631 length:588 start_codon:yes stop_codon:yes gene_type:complete